MPNLRAVHLHPFIRNLGVISIAGVVMAGCASTPAPTQQIAVANTAITSANSDGGNEFAPTQLKSAIDKLAAAQRAMGEKDYALAKQLAEQAQVDAQLASAIATSAKAKKAADVLQDSSRVLRQEINRQAN